ncbi:MAG: sugar porter family MFS transporter [Solirubrobacteraceae bacterium]
MPEFLTEIFTGENRFVLRISLLAALGGFLFGYDTGIVGGALPLIGKALHLDAGGKSWVTGSLLLGAVAGAVLSGYLADLLSRKWTKFVAGCIYTVAAIGSAFCPTLFLLGIARGVLGLAVGTASFVAPMYISEQSPKHLRGGMTALNQLAITFGIFIAYFVADAFAGTAHGWRWMFGLGAIPGIALAIAMLTVPHTPRWLIEQGRSDEARRVLEHTRKPDAVDGEVHDIEEVSRAQKSFGLGDLVGPRIRPMLIIGVLMAVSQQVIGINTVIYYGATILGFAGLSISGSIAQAVFIGIVNLVFAAIAVLILDRFGRRVPLIGGTIGSVIGLIALGWYFSTSTSFQHANVWIALASMLFYIACFELSLGPIFWVMIAEIFPLRSRAKAMGACTVFNWLFNFFVSFFFLDAVSALGRPGTFWMYAGLGILAAAFFAWRVPETKNRSLEEIERDVRGESAAPRGPSHRPATA